MLWFRTPEKVYIKKGCLPVALDELRTVKGAKKAFIVTDTFLCRDIELEMLEEGVLDNASYFGRIFARSGGLTAAATQAMKEQNIDFEIKPVVCDGIEACRMALLKLNKGILDGNFIEGMACIGGCIGGAGCLTHGEKNRAEVDKYGQEALEKNISDAISLLK